MHRINRTHVRCDQPNCTANMREQEGKVCVEERMLMQLEDDSQEIIGRIEWNDNNEKMRTVCVKGKKSFPTAATTNKSVYGRRSDNVPLWSVSTRQR